MSNVNLLLVFALFGLVVQIRGSDLSSRTIPVNLGCQGTSLYKWINLVQPTSLSQSCSYYIAPYNLYVCQVKVEFSTNLAPPTVTDGVNSASCRQGFIQIGRFKICGRNSNQHLYLNFDGTVNGNRLTIMTNPNGGSYDIKVTQLLCPPGTRMSVDERTRSVVRPSANLFKHGLINPLTFDTDLIAPHGCDQYYTESSGIIESFNYNNGVGQYPGEMQYEVCFKTYTTSQKLQLFGIGFGLASNEANTNAGCYDSYEATPGISSDYIFIPYSKILGSGVVAEYYCGGILKQMTLESTMFTTFSFVFKAGKYQSGPNSNTGYKFQYQVV